MRNKQEIRTGRRVKTTIIEVIKFTQIDMEIKDMKSLILIQIINNLSIKDKHMVLIGNNLIRFSMILKNSLVLPNINNVEEKNPLISLRKY